MTSKLEREARRLWLADAVWRFYGKCTRCGRIAHVAGRRKASVICLDCFDISDTRKDN